MDALKKPIAEEITDIYNAINPMLKVWSKYAHVYATADDETPVTELRGVTVGNLRAAVRLRNWVANGVGVKYLEEV